MPKNCECCGDPGVDLICVKDDVNDLELFVCQECIEYAFLHIKHVKSPEEDLVSTLRDIEGTKRGIST